ncbi:MAG: AMP-binding protein, partial [Leptolyngbyaceae bacterium]|nr:AMP-binding protein [Leptolyngbyaceae bacterium]
MSTVTLESNLQEDRLFNPPVEFSRNAHIKSFADYQQLCQEADADPQAFWGKLARHELDWFVHWDRVLEWQPPFAQWFIGGQLNVAYNCLDRHLAERGHQPALIWEGEPGDSRIFTYQELHDDVCRMANVMKRLGVKRGDRVGIYMPMIPEAAIAMLACARIGAPHTVVFGGFSAEALRNRLQDAEAKLVVTADGSWRKEVINPLKEQVDRALD